MVDVETGRLILVVDKLIMNEMTSMVVVLKLHEIKLGKEDKGKQQKKVSLEEEVAELKKEMRNMKEKLKILFPDECG